MLTEEMTREERAEYWGLVVDEFNCSGMTKTAYCEKNDIAVSTLNYWINKLGELASAEALGGNRFAELLPPVQDEPASGFGQAHTPHMPCLSLAIKDVRIDVFTGIPIGLLRQVIAEVRDA